MTAAGGLPGWAPRNPARAWAARRQLSATLTFQTRLWLTLANGWAVGHDCWLHNCWPARSRILVGCWLKNWISSAHMPVPAQLPLARPGQAVSSACCQPSYAPSSKKHLKQRPLGKQNHTSDTPNRCQDPSASRADIHTRSGLTNPVRLSHSASSNPRPIPRDLSYRSTRSNKTWADYADNAVARPDGGFGPDYDSASPHLRRRHRKCGSAGDGDTS